jgi:isoaspartyl peptidase/L-asparaginase-like protein (Ntn-hydrolase superfamily)
VHNCDGEHDMEATIMDGSTGRVGCVAGIRSLKNPVSASRKSRTRTLFTKKSILAGKTNFLKPRLGFVFPILEKL